MSPPIALDYRGLHIWLSSQWLYFFWGFLVLILFQAALATANIVRPYWTIRKATFRMLLDLAGSLLFCWLLKANLVTSFVLADLSPRRSAEIANAIDFWMGKMLPLAIILGVVIAVVNVYRIVRLKTPRVLPATAPVAT